jgi:O-antigen/teichoic acid export membrane protein
MSAGGKKANTRTGSAGSSRRRISSVLARLGRLSKESLIYGVGGAAARYTGLLLLPIYTRVFSAGEYGVLESILSLGALLVGLAMLGLDGAVPLLYFATEDRRERRQICTLWVALVTLVALPGTALLLFLADWVSLAATGTPRNAPLFQLGMAVLPFSLLQLVFSTILRLTFRPRAYAVLNFSLTTLTALISIYLVVALHQGVSGALWGVLLGTAAVCLVSAWTVRDVLYLPGLRAPAWPLARRLLQLGLPLVPAGLALWVISFSNTYFLIQLVGEAEAGIFRVGVRLAALLGLGIAAFQLAWTPFSLSIARQPDAPRVYSRVATLYTAGAVGAAVLLTGFAPLLLSLAAPPAYSRAAGVIGPLALAAAALGAYYIVATGVNLAQRTGYTAATTIAAAILNLTLNAVLIPQWGIIGAGLAALAANLASTVLIYLAAQRVWPLPYQRARLLIIWLAGSGCIMVAGFVNEVAPPALPLALALAPAPALAYAGVLLISGVVTPREIRRAGLALSQALAARRRAR